MTRGQRIVVAVLLLVLVLAVLWVIGQVADDLRDERDPTPTPVPTPISRSGAGGGVVGVFVEPDDGREPVLAELENAQESVTLEIYLLSDREMIEALKRAVARGVDVRVILEEHPFGGAGNQPEVFAELQDAGVQMRWSSPVFRFTHIKTLVVDQETALIMNLNFTRSAFTNNREFGAITTRPADVAQAVAIFEADWAQAEEPPDGPLIVSPTTSRRDLIGLMDSAEESLDIYAEVMRDEEVLDAIVAAEQRGVDVRLVMTGDEDDDDVEERLYLADEGVEVRLARGIYIHAKMILVDNDRAYIGSQNFTATSLDLNRELGIFITDRANIARLASTFEADFAAGRMEGER